MRKEQRAGDTLKNTTVKIGIILMVAIILATKEGERERNKINRRKKKDTEVGSIDSKAVLSVSQRQCQLEQSQV